MVAVSSQVLLLGALAATTAVAQNATSPTPADAPAEVETNHSRMSINAVHEPLLYNCGTPGNYNWDDIKYACAWEHVKYKYYFNLFIKRFDGTYEKQCHCRTGVASWGGYGAWASRWKYSTDREVTCYTRDGKTAAQTRSEFNSVGCPDPFMLS